MTKRTIFCLAFLFVVFCAPLARAEKILLVDDEDTRRIGARLRAELIALGFEVEMVPASAEEPSRASLEDAARTAGAVAALRVRASRAGVEVWVMDRVTSKTVLREVVAPGNDEGVVALNAVELLRASLLEVELPSYRPHDVAPTPAVTRILPPRSAPDRRLSLAIAPAGMLSPGGLGVTPHVDVWMRYRAVERFAMGLRLVTPTIPATVDRDEGRATVTISSASIAGDVLFSRRGAPLRGHAGVGLGVVWAHMEGTAAQSFVGRGDDVFAALSYVHGGATFALGDTARLFGDATVGVATPRPVVVFADRTVASWGQPVVGVALGVEVLLF